jgi:hypothetical protein
MTYDKRKRAIPAERAVELQSRGRRIVSYWRNLQPKIIRFFGAMVVACLAWFLFKLSATYSIIVPMPVKYVNPPQKFKVSSQLPTKWNVKVQGKGSDLIIPYLKGARDTLRVSLSKRGGERLDSLMTRSERTRIRRNLPIAVKVISVAPRKLKVAYAPKIYKMVPVRSNLDIRPAQGYFVREPIRFSPDSVMIAGTPEQLKDYQSWLTSRTPIMDITYLTKREVSLLQVHDIEISPAKVTATIKPERYTEGEIEKEIVVENVPVNERIELYPSKVKIKYLVPLDSYKQITEKDFRIVIDFEDIDPNAKYLVPELKGTPDILKGLRTEPPYVQYVITTVE